LHEGGPCDRGTLTFSRKGFGVEFEEFRRVLAEAKAELYPHMTDEELTFARDKAGAYCVEVRRRPGDPSLTRPFILRG
jgi:hypothetical protein